MTSLDTAARTATFVSSIKAPRPADKIIGKNLRALRQAKEMSQEELGALLTLTFQQIQKYEKGTNRISGSRILQVCEIFKITPNMLLLGVENPKAGARESYAVHFSEFVAATGREGIDFIRWLNSQPKQRRAFIRFAAALQKEDGR